MTTINKNKRLKVWQDSDKKCMYCGDKIKFEESQTEHIIPRRRGGSNNMENLGIACHKCNTRKKNRKVEEWRKYLSVRMMKAIERAVFDGLWTVHPYLKMGYDTSPIVEKSSELIALVEQITDNIEFHFERISDDN